MTVRRSTLLDVAGEFHRSGPTSLPISVVCWVLTLVNCSTSGWSVVGHDAGELANDVVRSCSASGAAGLLVFARAA